MTRAPSLSLLIAVAAVCAVAASCAKKPAEDLSWKRPIDELGRSFVAGDPERFLGSLLPGFAAAVRDRYTKEVMESQRATMVAKVGTGLEMSWRSLAVEDLDRAMLDSLQKAYEESFGSPLSFSAGKRLVVEYTFKGNKDRDIDTNEYSIVQVDGVWYLTEI